MGTLFIVLLFFWVYRDNKGTGASPFQFFFISFISFFALRLIGGERRYPVLLHIVEDSADVCGNVYLGFFRSPYERVLEKLVVFGTLGLLFDQTLENEHEGNLIWCKVEIN